MCSCGSYKLFVWWRRSQETGRKTRIKRTFTVSLFRPAVRASEKAGNPWQREYTLLKGETSKNGTRQSEAPSINWVYCYCMPYGDPLGSLSNNVFERRTSTGSGLFWFFDGGFAQIFSQIASITVKKLRNTNFISSRHVKREKTSLPVDVRRSKTPLLKLPIIIVTTWRISRL